ncbi:MAG: 4-hydroxy-tetrahydrodipicolinate reductase [Acidimicrobiales bacterium]|jgi:4-hydroxy-tetrahydrodipicolinate reductase
MGIRVAVFGAGGRMGTAVCEAVVSDADLDLVAAIDPGCVGQRISAGETELTVSDDLDELQRSDAEVIIDFTHIDAARETLSYCAELGIHAVVGTSGFTEADNEHLAASFTASNCLIAPNFAIGAVLMMRFAEMAAPFFETAEIIELHHDGKVDAPSGTAVSTLERMAAASSEWAPDPVVTNTIPGARGATGPGGIQVHSVRMRGMVAHQEVLLGTTGQTLTVRHDSYDRLSFMPGVVMAAKRIADVPGLTIGLDGVLGI